MQEEGLLIKKGYLVKSSGDGNGGGGTPFVGCQWCLSKKVCVKC